MASPLTTALSFWYQRHQTCIFRLRIPITSVRGGVEAELKARADRPSGRRASADRRPGDWYMSVGRYGQLTEPPVLEQQHLPQRKTRPRRDTAAGGRRGLRNKYHGRRISEAPNIHCILSQTPALQRDSRPGGEAAGPQSAIRWWWADHLRAERGDVRDHGTVAHVSPRLVAKPSTGPRRGSVYRSASTSMQHNPANDIKFATTQQVVPRSPRPGREEGGGAVGRWQPGGQNPVSFSCSQSTYLSRDRRRSDRQPC